jgi:hypothetical protein
MIGLPFFLGGWLDKVSRRPWSAGKKTWEQSESCIQE